MQNKIITPGTVFFFEYRCWESHESCDAKLWYHSHQKVTVLKCNNPEYYDIHPYWEDRCDDGMPLCYTVRFPCGYEYEAAEDELLDSKDEYICQDPPREYVKCKCKEELKM